MVISSAVRNPLLLHVVSTIQSRCFNYFFPFLSSQYQQTINDLNTEIHTLQQDQAKLHQKQAQNKLQKSNSHNNSNNTGSAHSSLHHKESFEDMKLKRDLVEKSRLL